MRPESVCSESGHESEKPGREISRRIDGVAAVVAEGDADVQHNKPDLKLNNWSKNIFYFEFRVKPVFTDKQLK